jgi:hypothetical protein
MSERHDPVGESYYSSLQRAEWWSEAFFYLGAFLSFAALQVDRTLYPAPYDFVQGAFVLTVIAVFATGLMTRFYLKSRAEDMRRCDLLSKATGIDLTHLKTQGYYNNQQSSTMHFLGAAIMESSFFTSRLLLRVARTERIKVAVYATLFICALLYRKTDLAFAATAASAVFSEQLLSQWIRVEWLRSRSETVYNRLHATFQAKPSQNVLDAHVLEAAMLYETSKANAGVAIPRQIFEENNAHLSKEWDEIRKGLSI